MFNHDTFRQLAAQFRDHADGYQHLGLTTDQAARWANHGFLPGEAQVWLDEGFSDALERLGQPVHRASRGPAADGARREGAPERVPRGAAGLT